VGEDFDLSSCTVTDGADLDISLLERLLSSPSLRIETEDWLMQAIVDV
jgi:hypothetical protein